MTDCFRPRDNGDRGGGFLALVFQSSDGDGGGGDAGGVLQSFARNLKVREISSKIDLDVMGRNFGRFAGGDMMMDAEEFDRFTKSTNLTRAQAASLWDILDADRSGSVSKAEFSEALEKLQSARAWLRHCPECVYANTCAYCQECNANCSDCTENAFCSSCWADHPTRHAVGAVGADDAEDVAAAMKRALDPVSQLRTTLLIKPLNWAYTSPLTQWLPVAQKAALRQALRSQQQAVDKALQSAAEAEEAALKAMNVKAAK